MPWCPFGEDDTGHTDPASYSLGQLAAIKGAIWPCIPNKLGPRPFLADGSLDPTNIFDSGVLWMYDEDDRQRAVDYMREKRWTHVQLGPLIESDGYHGTWLPARDYTASPEMFNQFLDMVEWWWMQGFIPIVFLHPDNWTFEQTRDRLTPYLSTDRARRLLRVVVPTGWEPTDYGWSAKTWARYFEWAGQLLPDALILGHTVTDIDAMTGEDELDVDTDKCEDGLGCGNARAWNIVAPHIHGWLIQNAAFADPDGIAPNGNTNFRNFQLQFSTAQEGRDIHSVAYHLREGFAGWPTSSKWGPNIPVMLYAAEYAAYWKFWHHRPEVEACHWGDMAMANGADGYFDGGNVDVPVKR